METVVITMMLWVRLTAWGVETDDTVNHLLETATGPNPQISMSFSSVKPLPVKENTWFQIIIRPNWMECARSFGIDDLDTGVTILWIPRRAFICNVDKLEINNEVFVTNQPLAVGNE
jgi:hypothetical protein